MVEVLKTSVFDASLSDLKDRQAVARITAPSIEALVEHQLPRFLQTQLLLELQRAHAGDGAEMLSKSRWAHVGTLRQVVDVQAASEILLEPCNGFRYLLARGSGGDKVLKLRSGADGYRISDAD